jgi:hypothetical protein
MVEMTEAANILNNVTDRSLVLFDELGRGTSTYDGISIAWAIVEYLHEHKGSNARTLFATHYHELNEMQNHYNRIRNFNVAVKDIDGKVIFLRKLVEGGSEHSFGIHVAQLAGMPPSIVQRANEVLVALEKEASEVFAGIEKRYNDMKAKCQELTAKSQKPTVFSGEMHYGNWHAVGGKNYLAQIFRDAGANYVINDEETAGENLEFEKMYSLAANADYWRILNSYPGEFSYDALKASEPRNELFKAFKERKVIYCNMKQTPYYEISPVQPDLLLKDFVAIFHPELVEKDYQPTFYYLLK